MFKLNVDRSEIYTNVRWRGLIKRQLVRNMIERFIDRQWSPFSALDVQNYVKLELRMWIPLHQIRGFMKTRLGLSYKKGNWRSINLDMQSTKLFSNFCSDASSAIASYKTIMKFRWKFNQQRYLRSLFVAKKKRIMKFKQYNYKEVNKHDFSYCE